MTVARPRHLPHDADRRRPAHRGGQRAAARGRGLPLDAPAALLLVGIVSLVVLLGVRRSSRAGPPRPRTAAPTCPSIRCPTNAGAQSAIIGTLWVMAITASSRCPLGVGAAIYLEEYANPQPLVQPADRGQHPEPRRRARRSSTASSGWRSSSRPLGLGPHGLTGALTLALLVLPVVIIATREAMRAVPRSIRTARWRWARRSGRPSGARCCPRRSRASRPASILALSRAIGEAAPLLLLGAVTLHHLQPDRPRRATYTALPIQIYNWIRSPSEEFQVLAAAAIVVLLVDPAGR